MKNIPLSLYIHIPWCIKKCPYCDFNSHALKNNLPETEYLETLLEDLQLDLKYVQQRPIRSIFFGGGTPSLISPAGIEYLLNSISKVLTFTPDMEVTLEANPGTVEHFNLADYKLAGINRISLGVQSFDNEKLQILGRIHKQNETLAAIDKLHQSNLKSFNLDLMHGLPKQTLDAALLDLQTAIDCQPPHISWYQLTIEPNTFFHKYPPALPSDDVTWAIQAEGEKLLAAAGFMHYEVSAFSTLNHRCQHNLNYWEFGDYLGIGAGAHSKTTDLQTMQIHRSWKTRNPKDYLDKTKIFLAGTNNVSKEHIAGEYMLNRLRLYDTLDLLQFSQYTGLPISDIKVQLDLAKQKGLINLQPNNLTITELGKRFLNDTMQIFLNEEVQHA